MLKKGGMIGFHDSGFPGVSRAIKEFVMKSKDFVVFGPIADIFYISKSETSDRDFMARLTRLNSIRERLKVVAKLTKLKFNPKNWQGN